MFLICYLSQDDASTAAIHDRLALANPPMVLVRARSVPELVSQVQTLPARVVLADIAWPQAVWAQLVTAARQASPGLPILALSPGATDHEWWHLADDLLRLDESLDLFLSRLHRAGETGHGGVEPSTVSMSPAIAFHHLAMTAATAPSASLIESPQFRQFAEMFSGMDEGALIEAFTAWVQQACQTSRVVTLLRDPNSGTFHCRAQRGLPSTLVPHCSFPQTAPLCHWLSTTGRILQKHATVQPPTDVLSGLDLMQASVAVPMVFDGQMVGILALGPRLIGHHYSAYELEGLFAICGQIAVAIHHCRIHHAVMRQQQMTEQMLGVMPSGTLVIGEDNRIIFVNAAAATILGKSRSMLLDLDLRALPSPLGDLAYEVLLTRGDVPRREIDLAPTGHPVAVSCHALSATPPSAMLLIEDLAEKRTLEAERERRVDLEVVTNLAQYLAHELRNPLVALSTFGNLAPTRAGDPDFQEFCDSVLQTEINRVNLILEQLLVLTNHVEFQFTTVDPIPMLERIAATEEIRSSVVMALPVSLPPLYGDIHRLETAITCILRTMARLASQQSSPASLRVDMENTNIILCAETPAPADITPDWLLNPWQQLMERSEEHTDFGLATARYILEQHGGALTATVQDAMLRVYCRLPLRTDRVVREEGKHDATKSARR